MALLLLVKARAACRRWFGPRDSTDPGADPASEADDYLDAR